jgi:Putative metal-binding motif
VKRSILSVLLLLTGSMPALSQSWYSQGLVQSGVPNFVAFDGTVALVATEPAFAVAIDRVDLSTGLAAPLELINTEAVDLRSGTEFAGGLAVLYRIFSTGRFHIRHYSFTGAITDITPPDNTGEASPLASDGATLYLIAGNVLMSKSGLNGAWVSGPEAPFTPTHDRSRGLVVGNRVILPSPSTLVEWSPDAGFNLLAAPPGMVIPEMPLAAIGDTAYAVLADRSTNPSQAVMWELPAAPGTPQLHPSALFYEYFFSNHLFNGRLYVGGIYGQSDFRSRLLEFDPGSGAWRTFNPQGSWANLTFSQVCDIASAGETLLVAWEFRSGGNLARLVTSCPDNDGDRFGAPGDLSCPGGADTDCDDNSGDIFPGRPENCDGVDNDCDGQIDEDAPGRLFFSDSDGDGFGNPLMTIEACTPPPGYATNNRDCDDNDSSIHPGAQEVCDGHDNDCNRLVDDAALLEVHADRHIRGDGGPSTQEPFPGLLVGLYDKSQTSCARTVCGGVSWKSFTCVVSSCPSVVPRRRTNSAGDAIFRLPPGGSYLVIGDARTDPGQLIDKHLGTATDGLVCGEVVRIYLQELLTEP